MKNLIKLLVLVSFFVCNGFSGCKENQHRYIYVQNNSGMAIYYGLSYSYPDTSLTKVGDIPGNNGSVAYKVYAGEEITLYAAAFAVNPTMQMFLLDAGVVEKEPWDSIVKYNKVLRRYQYTESDMEKWNWRITYP
jgi:hypothetical protein